MQPSLTIASRNYGSWSLRGWLLCRLAGLELDVTELESTDPDTRAELLLLAPSFRVPCLRIDEAEIWDTMAIAEYLHERFPDAGLYPADVVERALCRSISGEMHSGFANLRSARVSGSVLSSSVTSSSRPARRHSSQPRSDHDP
jgi:glutathione S-transferase